MLRKILPFYLLITLSSSVTYADSERYCEAGLKIYAHNACRVQNADGSDHCTSKDYSTNLSGVGNAALSPLETTKQYVHHNPKAHLNDARLITWQDDTNDARYRAKIICTDAKTDRYYTYTYQDKNGNTQSEQKEYGRWHCVEKSQHDLNDPVYSLHNAEQYSDDGTLKIQIIDSCSQNEAGS
jgi:hypothetical protein